MQFDEIAEKLGKFFARDVFYLLGGFSIILASLVACGVDLIKDYPINLQLYILGVSYLIGYPAQEMLSLFLKRIVTTTPHPLGTFLRRCYKAFTASDYQGEPQVSFLVFRATHKLTCEELTEFDRTESLQQLGITMGSCWLVSSVVLVGIWLIGVLRKSPDNSPCLFYLGLLLFVLAACLILIGRVKGMQWYSSLAQLETRLAEQAESPRGADQGN